MRIVGVPQRRRRNWCRWALLLFLVACAASSSSAQVITQFRFQAGNLGLNGTIASGPDGSIWVAAYNNNKISRITRNGVSTEFFLTNPESRVFGITSGPDGQMWFTVSDGKFNDSKVNSIGRITAAGALSEFPLPNPGNARRLPWGITRGPDGNVWFAEVYGDRIGRITPTGVITEFPTSPSSGPRHITGGPDGNLWFTEFNRFGNRVGRITPTGTITEFQLPNPDSGPAGITSGADGNLWFVEWHGNRVGRITTAGGITEFPLPTVGVAPSDITSGPDGNLWFTEYNGNMIGRITPKGVIREFQPPFGGRFVSITSDPEGNLFFSSQGWIGLIARESIPMPCFGDCNGDESITMEEIATILATALGSIGVAPCDSLDANHDQNATVEDIIVAVSQSTCGCNGCVTDPSPTPTRTLTTPPTPTSPPPSPHATSTPVIGPSPRVVLFRESWERAAFGVYRPNGDDSPVINGDSGGWEVGDTATSIDPDDPDDMPCQSRSANSVEIRPGATGKEAAFRAVDAPCGGDVFISPTRILNLPFSSDLRISFRESGSISAVNPCDAVVFNVEFDRQFTLSYILQRSPSWTDSSCDGLFTPFPLSLALRGDGLYVRQLVPDLIAAGLYDPSDPEDSLPTRVTFFGILVDADGRAAFDDIMVFRP